MPTKTPESAKRGPRKAAASLPPPDAQLITTAELAGLFRTSEKALVLARMKRASWMPPAYYLGRRVLYRHDEALAMLTSKEAA